MVTKIRDLPTDAISVTDLDDVGVQGSDSAQNISPAFQGVGAMLGRMNSGTDALEDTVTYCDPTDTTKLFRTDGGNIPSGTTRVLDAEKIYRSAPLETVYTASGTHTFRTSTTYFQLIGVGGGAGGGGVDGQGPTYKGAASGGSSGFFGQTEILAKGAIATGTIVIGALGAGGAGAGGANGSNGGNTTWSDGTNSFTWGGGKGGQGITADTGFAGLAGPPNRPSSTGTIYGSSDRATQGWMRAQTSFSSAPPDATGGIGGNSPFGQGGSGGSNAVGGNAVGYGAGGGGGASWDVSTNYGGGDGTAGLLIVREW